MSHKIRNNRDTCFYCERKFTFKDYGERNAILKTVDHIVPESKGGKDAKINTVACCHHCNVLKGSYAMDEFIEKVNGLIQRGETYKNIPKECLPKIIDKAMELKKYVESKADKLYSNPGLSFTINISI